MRIPTKIVFATALAAPLVVISSEAPVEASDMRSVEQYSCKDVMRESGSDRENAIAFLHGFILGQSGKMQFDLELLAEQTDAFVDHCLDNPNDGALNSMMKVKG